MARLAQPVYRMAMTFTPVPRAAVIGLCTTLLPCGWLYAFVATAAGTASVSGAAVTMFVFWLGTLPVMMTVGAGTRALIGPAARRLPILTAVTLVAVSLYTMVGRAAIDPTALARATSTSSPKTVPTPGAAACCKEHVN
jgi:sulfite exporter TauE/SafE